MQETITRTKVALPHHRPDLLSRPRLLHTLRELLNHRLVLVIAPAGYGKTTVLIDLVHTLEIPACWYALSPVDRNLHQFAAHFIAAIARQFPRFGEDSMAALQNLESGRISFDQFLTILINEMDTRIQQRFVLVIDDYHLVDDFEPVSTFVNQFLLQSGDNCHIILASRTLLTLPDLALLVARGEVDGLDFEELAFRPDEVQALIRQKYNQIISDEDAEELVASTEGWITGMLLSANIQPLRMASRIRLMRSSGVDLYGYLAHQVLNQQSPAMRDFLLRTSYMDEIDLNLCIEILDPVWRPVDQSWENLLEQLVQQNLFVTPVGEHGDSVRYHHLFQEFLQRRLQSERPAEVRIILNRLVEVYLRKEQWEQAYLYAERLEDPETIIQLVEKAGLRLIYAGRTLLLQEWLNKLPANAMRTRPRLIWLQGYCWILLGQVEQGLKRLNEAEKLLRNDGSSVLLAQVLAHRSIAHRFRGDYSQSIADADAALILLDELATQVYLNSGNHNDAMTASAIDEHRQVQALAYRSKGLGLCMQGNLLEGIEWQRRSLDLYQEIEDVQNMATLSMEIAITYANSGQNDRAYPLYLRALDAWRNLHNLMGQSNVYNALGVYYHEQGEHVPAFASMAQAVDCARRSGYARLEATALISLGDLVFEVGLVQSAQAFYSQAYTIARRLDERYLVLYLELARATLAWSAREWNIAYECLDAAGRLVLSKSSSYEWGLYRQAMGRYYLAQETPQHALEPLQDAATCFARGGQGTDEAKTRIYLAVANQLVGKTREATRELENALLLYSKLSNKHPVVVAACQVESTLRTMSLSGEQGGQFQLLIDAVQNLNRNCPALRRDFRRQIHSVFSNIPVDPPMIEIRALGRAEVMVNGKPITLSEWQTRVSRDLLFCLLTHPKGLTKEQIGLHFWPDCSATQLKTRFKNTIYRMRNALGQEVIRFEDGIYVFDNTLDYEYDVELFLDHVEAGKNNAGCPTHIQEQIHTYTMALSYYKGDFLPDSEASWSYLERERLHQIYRDITLELAQLCYDNGEYTKAMEWCRKLLQEDPCLEDAHRLAMQIYAMTGNRAGVARQYALCQKALQEEIDAPPSPQTEELYLQLMQ